MNWNFRKQSHLLLLILILDGAILGAAAGGTYAGVSGAPGASGDSGQEAGWETHEIPAACGGIRQADSGGGQIAESVGKKYVALTFDDGPHSVYTEQLLDGLKVRGVPATFFLMGQNIEGKEALVLRMRDEGHLIGNHSYRHLPMTRERAAEVCDSIEMTEQMIEQITGKRPEYLRPPYGDWNEELECKMNLTTVFWTVDSLDWKLKNTPQIVSRVLKGTRNGDIILMHDIYDTSVKAALQIVDQLQEQGYEFVTVDELLID